MSMPSKHRFMQTQYTVLQYMWVQDRDDLKHINFKIIAWFKCVSLYDPFLSETSLCIESVYKY